MIQITKARQAALDYAGTRLSFCMQFYAAHDLLLNVLQLLDDAEIDDYGNLFEGGYSQISNKVL